VHSADPLSPTALTVLEFDPASGADLICIKSALSVLDIDPPSEDAYTTSAFSAEQYQVAMHSLGGFTMQFWGLIDIIIMLE
jgi:hypothetical protein